MPAIQHSLGIGYAQIGLLTAVPLLIGGMLELPAGLLPNRRAAIAGGGALFVLSLAGVAFAQNFTELLVAVTLFFPASGFFVSLTQASLMDAEPDRQAQLMTRWDAAGWTGAVAGPLLLVSVLAAGGTWRTAYLAVAAAGALAWVGVLASARAARRNARRGDAQRQVADHGHSRERTRPEDALRGDARDSDAERKGESGDARRGGGERGDDGGAGRARVRDVVAGARAAWRWLVLIEVADLLVDVLSGFVAVYLVRVAHTTTVVAAVAVAIRLGAGLAGDALLVIALKHTSDRAVLRATAIAAAVLYPAFLVVPGVAAKMTVLALVSIATATWYPLLQARLYGTVPSAVAVTLGTATGMAAAIGPLAVGFLAGVLGLSWALAGLAVVPFVLLSLLRQAEQAH